MSEESKSENMPPRERACLICGKQEFEWGTPVAGHSVDPKWLWMYFRPEGSTWEDGDIPLTARRCLVCGNVQFFINDS